MKTKLLFLFTFMVFSLNAQTTHNLDWFMGIGTNADLTIESGDTVIWTWTSPNHTVENDPDGTSVETFDSGILGPNGSTFSHTFTVVGDNDYYCSIHGAASMSGTITVEPSLSVEEDNLANFKMIPNPATSLLNIQFSEVISRGDIEVFTLLGKQVATKTFENTREVQMDIANLASGLYLVSIRSENTIQTRRFIKY